MVCVISKNTFGPSHVHRIQSCSTWSINPYGVDYAIVPADMVAEILATGGYCDLTYNAGGTEVVSFTVRERPEPTERTPSQWDQIEAQVTYTAMMTDTLLGG